MLKMNLSTRAFIIYCVCVTTEFSVSSDKLKIISNIIDVLCIQLDNAFKRHILTLILVQCFASLPL